MSATKSYPVEIVLSLTTGRLLKKGGMGELQDLFEHIAGHPVWTHELADRAFVARMREHVLLLWPPLCDAEEWNAEQAGRSLEIYLAGYVKRARAAFGETLEIASLELARTEDPVASAERLRSTR